MSDPRFKEAAEMLGYYAESLHEYLKKNGDDGEAIKDFLVEVNKLADWLESISSMDPSSIAKELGRRGGLKGGHARAASLTKEQRSAIAKAAAAARWKK